MDLLLLGSCQEPYGLLMWYFSMPVSRMFIPQLTFKFSCASGLVILQDSDKLSLLHEVLPELYHLSSSDYLFVAEKSFTLQMSY